MEVKLTVEEENLFRKIGEVADEMGIPAYVVGGFVRDNMLGKACKDIDVVCIGSGIDLAKNLSEKFTPKPAFSYFKNFGTAMLKFEDYEIEFVGARKESYRSDSRKPIVEDGTLEEDQLRRDFTINAMAIAVNGVNFGKILDPFGGVNHLKEKTIITPLDPIVTFSDDPLRMMRAIRFATQLNFVIEENTFKSIREVSNRLKIVSEERIVGELNKIIMASKPSIGFKMLLETGLLDQFFPEMVKLYGVDIVKGHAHKDNFFHTLKVLDNVADRSDDLWLRWAAILHDIAKPVTKRYEEGHGWTFHGHDAIGARWVSKIFRRLKLPLDHKMKFVEKMVLLHLRPISLTKEAITDSAIRRLIFDAGDDLDSLMTLCEADITSKNKDKVKRYLSRFEEVRSKIIDVEERDKIKNWQPPISGEEIMKHFNIKPSREVGKIKTVIREAILEGDIPNNYEAAFDLMIKTGKELGLK
jgi:putative nucleotidyltransferase with HDIG domain